jgi:hypothetical protein
MQGEYMFHSPQYMVSPSPYIPPEGSYGKVLEIFAGWVSKLLLFDFLLTLPFQLFKEILAVKSQIGAQVGARIGSQKVATLTQPGNYSFS